MKDKATGHSSIMLLYLHNGERETRNTRRQKERRRRKRREGEAEEEKARERRRGREESHESLHMLEDTVSERESSVAVDVIKDIK